MYHDFYAENNNCIIAPLEEQDIEYLRQWRNDKELSRFLRPIPYITPEMEKKWFDDYLKDQMTCFFVIIDKESNRVIGSVALYNIEGQSCEIGKVVIGDNSAHGKGMGYNSFLLAMCVGIQELGIKNFRLDVHTENIAALSIYVKAGFEICGSHDFLNGGKELEMKINVDRFRACNPAYKEVIVKKTEFSDRGGYASKLNIGENCIISSNSSIGEGTIIMHNCIIEDDVHIGQNCYIDSNCIIRKGTILRDNSFVGANTILGEHQMDFIKDHKSHHELDIGSNAVIRSGSIIYTGTRIGNYFQSGHQVTIREKASIGNHCSIGTLSDIQGYCNIGNYVNMHSNVHIGQESVIDDYVWIFPYVVLTNDPTPPSEELQGVHVHSFAIIAAHSVILPGVDIASDSLVAAGANVTKNVEEYAVVGGNPAKKVGDVRNIKNHVTGEAVYPWRFHFKRRMPWEDSDFVTWINGLSENQIDEYHLIDFK